MKIERTPILNRYFGTLIVRIVIVVFVTVLFFTRREIITSFLTQPALESVKSSVYWPLVAMWAIQIVMMVMHLIPPKVYTMALLKRKEDKLDLDPNYKRERLLQFVQKQNVRAWYVMLVWVVFNGVIGIFYLYGILKVADMFMISTIFFLCDHICILFYCPFQSHIMHNKCCVNCRIYDWGHFMMFTPMLFVKHFFSWTLFWLALIVLIRWEIVYARHPERFWQGSNRNLRCSNCNDKSCQIKRILAKNALQPAAIRHNYKA